MLRGFIIGLLLAFTLFGKFASADIQIDGYTDASNDRFTNSGSFVLAGFNLSGVGQVSSVTGQGQWATLISPNVVISAWHYAPPTNATVNFYLDNDPGSTPVMRTVTSINTRVGGTDIWLGVLNSPVTGATYYGISDEELTGPPGGGTGNITSAGSFQGSNSYMFGRSPKANAAWLDQAIGRNLVYGYWENVVFNGDDNDSLILEYNASTDPEYVQYESHFRVGDSGGPFFIERNGSLVLLGTNGFVLEDDSKRIVASGVNYVGNQAGAIRNFIQLNAVPEPGSGLLLCGLLAIGAVWQRRRAG